MTANLSLLVSPLTQSDNKSRTHTGARCLSTHTAVSRLGIRFPAATGEHAHQTRRTNNTNTNTQVNLNSPQNKSIRKHTCSNN